MFIKLIRIEKMILFDMKVRIGENNLEKLISLIRYVSLFEFE